MVGTYTNKQRANGINMKSAKPFDWKRPPQLRLSLDDELIIDNFAGGGGASMGIEQALGRSVDVAINHDPEAIAMHEANHPGTKHYVSDVFEVDPIEVCNGKKVALAWFSPDCKHFSKAKGGKPVSRKVRGLAKVATKWAELVKPRVIILENVEEFKDWGPLLDNDKPCPDSKGLSFRRFVRDFEKLGYQVDHRELRACDYGAPTTRKRLFMIARCDGQPITWPAQTHGKEKGLKPYNTAADCIDWSVPGHSIFLTKEEAKKFNVRRPLAEKTMTRIDKGLKRNILNAKNPFIVPFITEHANGSSQRNMSVDEPLRTICAQVKGGHFALVTAFLVKYYGADQNPQLEEPMHTVTSRDRFGLLTVFKQGYKIVDIFMRMLLPRELYRAQGFPDEYIIDPIYKGKKLTKVAQVRMCGNSVSPVVAAAIVRANIFNEEKIKHVGIK